jgi:CheY-like chemotaxis protein
MTLKNNQNIAVIGFTESEYQTFERFFQLVSARRVHRLSVVSSLAEASVILLRTRDTALLDEIVPQVRKDQLVIAVGTRRLAQSWAQLPRPINLNAVLLTVDEAFSTLTTLQAISSADSSAPTVVSPRELSVVAMPSKREALVNSPTIEQNIARVPAPVISSFDTAVSSTRKVRILVVDDSDVALKFIHSRLSAFGFDVDKCASGEEALVRVAQNDYRFVFLDVMMEGIDGFQTCKSIKASKISGRKPPVVVMLSSRAGAVDKVRSTFAGCDAYLKKPLDETQLLKVLLRHAPSFPTVRSVMQHANQSGNAAALALNVNGAQRAYA